jgi:flavorubredoxin
MAVKITEDIHWIGVDNPGGRDFHGINTPKGGSYNSYLIFDNKPTIIDTTDTPFLEEYLESLKSIIDPIKIQYIVVNHAEPDHSGAIKDILKECTNAKIICTEKCKEFLIEQFSLEANFQTVKDSDELNIGKKTLKFYTDPMVHWPETMMTYLVEDKALFSADLFGTEISHELMGKEDFTELTRDYFAIVMRPFAAQVKKAIDKARTLNIELICPSHGPAYKNDTKIIDTYEKLATNPEENKATIIYYSIWHSTEKMAKEIEKELKDKGIHVHTHNLAKSNFVNLMAEAMTSKFLILGSMTIATSYHPLFDALFPFLKLNNQKGKKAAVFGTHGWAPGSVPKLKAKLEELDYKVTVELDSRFKPAANDQISEFIKNIT